MHGDCRWCFAVLTYVSSNYRWATYLEISTSRASVNYGLKVRRGCWFGRSIFAWERLFGTTRIRRGFQWGVGCCPLRRNALASSRYHRASDGQAVQSISKIHRVRRPAITTETKIRNGTNASGHRCGDFRSEGRPGRMHALQDGIISSWNKRCAWQERANPMPTIELTKICNRNLLLLVSPRLRCFETFA